MKENHRKSNKKEWIFLSVFFLFSVACAILGVLCLAKLQTKWVAQNLPLCASVYCIVIILLYGFSAWLLYETKTSGVRAMLTLYILILFCLILWWIFQKTGFFEVFGDSERLQAYLKKAGIWMPALYVILQFLQVVILPIPSIVSTVAGVALFGAFWTTVYSFIGIVLGSIFAFYIGKRWGYRAANWLVGAEKLKTWQKKLKGRDNVVLTVMFLLPVFPDDILCFLAGISTMTWRYFLIMMSISRFIAITSTCYSFDLIPINTWWGGLLWLLIIFGLITATVVVYKNVDKIQAWIKGIKKSKNNKKEED